jgi:hypothetical protein
VRRKQAASCLSLPRLMLDPQLRGGMRFAECGLPGEPMTGRATKARMHGGLVAEQLFHSFCLRWPRRWITNTLQKSVEWQTQVDLSNRRDWISLRPVPKFLGAPRQAKLERPGCPASQGLWGTPR